MRLAAIQTNAGKYHMNFSAHRRFRQRRVWRASGHMDFAVGNWQHESGARVFVAADRVGTRRRLGVSL